MNDPGSSLVDYCLHYCDITKMSKEYLEQYFPGLANNKGNSMAAEQSMNKFGSFTHVVTSMDFDTMSFFLFWLCCDINELIARKTNDTTFKPKIRAFY